MRFVKMQGCGNDYVYVNCFEEKIDDRPALARRVADRHFGVGSDGLICICPSDTADFQMDMYNMDGSNGGMCGNGIRCVAKYVYEKGMTDKKELTIQAGGGIRRLWLNVSDGRVDSVRVNMGAPELRPQFIPIAEHGKSFVNRSVIVGQDEFFVTCVSVGNPHGVVFVDDVSQVDVAALGPRFENHPLFPEKCNAEFVQIVDRKRVKMRVWERGSGETMACGTGATACAVASILCGHTDNALTVELLGGELFIEWDRERNELYMTGPAVTVFDGELYL